MTELMKMLVDAGYPRNEMDHHDSDLYVYVTPVSEKVTKAWCNSHGYRQSWQCPIFRDQITGKLMYECICCYAE